MPDVAADNPDRISLSTRDLENDSAYSTWRNRTPEQRRRRYVSVDHALNWLTHLAHARAIDVQALASPGRGSPDPDSFIIDQGEQAVLAICFNTALARAGDPAATIWCRVRLEQATHRSFEISKTQVGRIVGEVEGLIVEELKRRGRWVSGHVRSEDEAREVEYGKEEIA